MIGNDLWNATRVSNFLRAMGVRPTRWQENIAEMANIGKISVDEFLKMDPISYGVRVWGFDSDQKLKNVLGVINYHEMLSAYGAPRLLAMTSAELETVVEPKPLDSPLKTYEQANAEFEKLYAQVKYRATTWDKVDEAYAKMEEALIALSKHDETDAAEKKTSEALQILKEAETKPLIEEFEQVKTKWSCPTCSAVWRTKAKTE
jgi:cell fate (sporulation/competence/biofilm development) regulator YmcA (YheA/YmcA/DUF963 family)